MSVRAVPLVAQVSPAVPDVDLVLFPGGGNGPSAFEPWQPLLPPSWRVTTVCLPGRGPRLAEPLPISLPDQADEIAAALGASDGCGRMVFFGHSMGALLALEVATRLTPALLVTAACAPVVDPVAYGDPDWEKVRDVVRRRAMTQGIDDPAFVEELADLAAPILRADLLMLDGYRLPTRPVRCAVVSYYGTSDAVPAEPWSAVTSESAEVVRLAGDHYFFQAGASTLIADIARRATDLPTN